MTHDSRPRARLARRSLLLGTGGLVAASRLAFGQSTAPAIITADAARPQVPHGVMTGDVTRERAIVWSRSDRPARMMVEYATTEAMQNPVRVRGPLALDGSDFTSRVDLQNLPADQDIFYRVSFVDAGDLRTASAPATGRFRTPPASRRDVTFQFSGDTAGQGWGINPDFGGMKLYEAMRRANADFFIHSGDNIYADGPIQAEVRLPDGSTWRNITTPEKSKVAETLAEFRGCYKYNLMDDNVRRVNAEVPQIWQWDDHEVMNNWSPAKDIRNDSRYTEKRVPLLVARATRAFLDYAPMRVSSDDAERVYRRIPYGPLLDVFVIDMRSYRGPNTANRQSEPGPESVYLGAEQLRWLKQGLLASRATWKVVASDMPIGLLVGDGNDAQGRPLFEAVANGDGPVLGRELELAELLRAIKYSAVKNVVWVTADVHYAAAHFYDPAKAQFTDFDGFWEFVAGPAHAGTFGPNAVDNTFGLQVVWQKAPPAGQDNLSPAAGLQFYGEAKIDGRSEAMSVALKDLSGATLWSRTLEPQR